MTKLRFTWIILLFFAGVPLSFTFVERNAQKSTPQLSDTMRADTVLTISQEVIRFWARIGEVEFPHLDHVDDFGMDCVECHHETNASTLDIPHESYFNDFYIDCKQCHNGVGLNRLEPRACSECHHTVPNGIADETLSSKVVIHRLCWDCHDSGTGVDASESCISCHSGSRTSFMEPLPDSLKHQ